MTPRPFPFGLRVGVDITQISRIRDIITGSANHKILSDRKCFNLLRRILTVRERNFFKGIFAPRGMGEQEVANTSAKIANYLSGRWAAKEACIKAVKPRRITLLDVEVWYAKDKEPYAIILDPQTAAENDDSSDASANNGDELGEVENCTAAEQLDRYELVPSHENISGQIARLSITHDGDYACAVALVASDH